MTRKSRSLLLTALLTVTVVALADRGRADDAAAFYAGKTLNTVIGFSAGGGYDLYARLLDRYMGKYIPGNPTLVPQNMPGAGSLKAAKYLFDVAPKDGTAFGIFSRSLPLGPVVGLAGADFDARKFNWLGSMAKDVTLCVTSESSGIKTWDDALNKDFTLGGEGRGSDPDIFANVLKNVFHAKARLITGYPGTADIFLAIQRGELSGFCGVSYSSVLGRWNDQLQRGEIHIIVQGGLEKDPALPNVPNMLDFASDARQKTLMRLILAPQAMARPFAAPPGTPPERLDPIKTAFAAALRDPDLLDEAKKLQVNIEFMQPAEIASLLEELYQAPPDLAAEAARDSGL